MDTLNRNSTFLGIFQCENAFQFLLFFTTSSWFMIFVYIILLPTRKLNALLMINRYGCWHLLRVLRCEVYDLGSSIFIDNIWGDCFLRWVGPPILDKVKSACCMGFLLFTLILIVVLRGWCSRLFNEIKFRALVELWLDPASISVHNG